MTQVKGWCPGALRPMQSADGWLLRVRPPAGRLDAAQIGGLVELAARHGIDAFSLSNRANIQIRGLSGETITPLQDDLRSLGLIDTDPVIEGRRNIVVTPYATVGDLNYRIYDRLCAELAGMPDLPAKFGFAIDCGAVGCLGTVSADIRFELCDTGIVVRADGAPSGSHCDTPEQAVARAVALVEWFAQTNQRRMRDASPPAGDTLPRPDATHDLPVLYAPFGHVTPAMFAELAGSGLRLTPWRAVLPDTPVPAAGWLNDGDHPLMRVDACPGAPFCGASTVETRNIARELAATLPPNRRLHASGCNKHCARSGISDLTVTGRDGKFDLALAGVAVPAMTLIPIHHLASRLAAYFRDPDAPHL